MHLASELRGILSEFTLGDCEQFGELYKCYRMTQTIAKDSGESHRTVINREAIATLRTLKRNKKTVMKIVDALMEKSVLRGKPLARLLRGVKKELTSPTGFYYRGATRQ